MSVASLLSMDPQLRALLDHSKFHQGAVREVAPLLPGDDDALAALLTETCTGADQLGFLLVITAALDAGRTLDAALLTTCAGLCIDATRLGCFAWKMTGDVSAALMAALARGRFGYPMHAGILLVILEWCAKHRGGVLPEGFAAEARRLARAKELKKDTVILLATIAARWGDAAFIAVLRQHHLANVWEKAMESGAAYAGSLVKIFDDPAMAFVPAAPPRTIAHQQPVRRAVEKISRNDPCPCGSGKKYKRCCFDKDRERLTFSSEVAGLTYAELRAEPDTGLTELRIKKMPPHELARLDPRKVPSSLRTVYLMQCTGLNLLERSAEIIEVMTFDDDEDFERAWDFVMFFVMRAQRKDIAERIVAARARHTFKNELPDRYRLILAHDDPAWELRLLDALARKLLTETDPEKLASHAYGIICSRHAALGILAAHGLIARTDRKQASFLLQAILETRDKLDLPPDDPFSDVLEKRLAEETSDEGADAARLREARQRLDVKAAEVRTLKEEIDHQRRRLDRQERAQREREATPVASPAPSAADEATLREMRARLATLKATLGERGAERLTLRRELEKAHDELETLRREEGGAAGTASASASEGGAVDEAAFYLPEQPAGNQPLRLAEFPPRFRETLEALPRQAARGALAMIGRLAGGEPAAFVGVVQLKACHGILRQRVGSEHRLLFRLLPDRVQVVDFINRRDLDRKIKALRAAGG